MTAASMSAGNVQVERSPRFVALVHSAERCLNGVHDMGGMDGFGKVDPEKDEPTFHAPWEGRVLAMEYAGAWRIDHSRLAQEN